MAQLTRILVVDDQPKNVKLLEDLLNAQGYVVDTASSGRDGDEQAGPQSGQHVAFSVTRKRWRSCPIWPLLSGW